MCKNMSLDDVSPERMNAEYLKLLKGDNPSKGLRFLKECGHLPKCLENLVGCPQDPRWHPERDAFEHTLCVMDAMKDILQREKIDGERYIVLMLSAMLHDVGKANTTVITKEKISSKGHAITGVPIARDFMNSIFVNHKVIEQVIPLVKEHMSHCNKFGDKAVRKLSVRMEPSNISNLCILMEADCSGRPPIPRGKNENILIIEESAKRQGLMFGSITPFIQGKDLIELGLKPGPNFSNIISDMKERQISGEIQSKEQAMKFVRKVHA
jgi:tRNA nucleotidyltransferase (CCA-adding enzyme)